MNGQWHKNALLAGLLCMLVVSAAGAAQMFRWVDEQGVAHFSDRPPGAAGDRAEQLAVPRYAAPDRPPEENPYSILNQSRRIEAARRQLADERLERQRLEQERELQRRQLESLRQPTPPATPAVVIVNPRPAHRPPVRPYPGYPPPQGRPWSLWERDHPAYRPRPAHPPPRVPYGRAGIE